MEDFSDILSPDAVSSTIAIRDKKALFRELGATAQRVAGLDARAVVDRLGERERLSSTGFGGGVAIPHAKIDGLDRVIALFVRLPQPIEFAAIDASPVDIVFVLLSPPEAGVDHLKALARVSRRLRDREFVAKLRGAGGDDALFVLLSGGEARDAA